MCIQVENQRLCCVSPARRGGRRGSWGSRGSGGHGGRGGQGVAGVAMRFSRDAALETRDRFRAARARPAARRRGSSLAARRSPFQPFESRCLKDSAEGSPESAAVKASP